MREALDVRLAHPAADAPADVPQRLLEFAALELGTGKLTDGKRTFDRCWCCGLRTGATPPTS